MIHISIRPQALRAASLVIASAALFFMLLPSMVQGQMISVTWEVDTTFYAPMPLPGSSPGEPAYDFDEEDLLNGYTTYSVYANFTNPTDKLVAVYAANTVEDLTAPLTLNAPCGCYDTPSFGVFYEVNLNELFFPIVPELEFDSYLSFDGIGVLATPNISLNYNLTTGFCIPNRCLQGNENHIPLVAAVIVVRLREKRLVRLAGAASGE